MDKFILTASMITNVIIGYKGNAICTVNGEENVVIRRQIYNIVARGGSVRGVIHPIQEVQGGLHFPDKYNSFRVM